MIRRSSFAVFFHDPPERPSVHRVKGCREVHKADNCGLLVAVAYLQSAPQVEDVIDTAPTWTKTALSWAGAAITGSLEPRNRTEMTLYMGQARSCRYKANAFDLTCCLKTRWR